VLRRKSGPKKVKYSDIIRNQIKENEMADHASHI
jgi:hypothetical protein